MLYIYIFMIKKNFQILNFPRIFLILSIYSSYNKDRMYNVVALRLN